MSGDNLPWIWTLMSMALEARDFFNGAVLPWATLLALGAFHGINPGMGWLFAVALGMQERSREAVLRAMLPLGLGHALAIVPAIAVAIALGRVLPTHYVQWAVAGVLVLLGLLRFVRHRHPRWASMRVSMKGLTCWSFLMASAHGAGLMVVPVFIAITVTPAHACHSGVQGTPASDAVLATVVHSLGYLGVTAAAAWIVYEKLGVNLLRKAWFNLDLVWAAALVATGVATVLL
jgi:hypothetical protein